MIVYGMGRDACNQGKNAKFGITLDEDLCPPIIARGPCAVAMIFDEYNAVVNTICARIAAGTSNQIAADGHLVIEYREREREKWANFGTVSRQLRH